MTIDRHQCLTTLVDSVKFTFPYSTDLNLAYEVLGIPEDDFMDMPFGLYRYTKQRACGAVAFYTRGIDARMGVHVQISGEGCREYETHWCNFDRDTWICLFDRVISCNGTFSRLDLAIDEFRYSGEQPFFTIGSLIARVKRNMCKSKFKTVRVIQKIRIEGGENLGNTIYFVIPWISKLGLMRKIMNVEMKE